MINIALFFLVFGSFSIAPYFPLEEEPKIEISMENQEKYFTGEALLYQERKQLEQELLSKRFPLQWTMFIFLFLSGIYLAYYTRRRWQPVLLDFIYPKVDPLKEMEKKIVQLKGLGAVEAFMGLDHCLRHYLEVHYAVNLSSYSTVEILQMMKGRVDKKVYERWAQLFFEIDYVKFADWKPLEEEKVRALEWAREMGRIIYEQQAAH